MGKKINKCEKKHLQEDLVNNVLEKVGGKITFNAIGEIGKFQEETDLPFSYRTKEELLDMLSLFIESTLDDDNTKYPNLMLIKKEIKNYE